MCCFCNSAYVIPNILVPVYIAPSFTSGYDTITDIGTPIVDNIGTNNRKLSIHNSSSVDNLQVDFGTSDGQSHVIVVAPGETISIEMNYSQPSISVTVTFTALSLGGGTLSFTWNAST